MISWPREGCLFAWRRVPGKSHQVSSPVLSSPESHEEGRKGPPPSLAPPPLLPEEGEASSPPLRAFSSVFPARLVSGPLTVRGSPSPELPFCALSSKSVGQRAGDQGLPSGSRAAGPMVSCRTSNTCSRPYALVSPPSGPTFLPLE